MDFLTCKVKVKQTLKSKILFKVVLLIGSMGLISSKRACNLLNKSIDNGAFRYKVDKNEWTKITGYEFSVIGRS